MRSPYAIVKLNNWLSRQCRGFGGQIWKHKNSVWSLTQLRRLKWENKLASSKNAFSICAILFPHILDYTFVFDISAPIVYVNVRFCKCVWLLAIERSVRESQDECPCKISNVCIFSFFSAGFSLGAGNRLKSWLLRRLRRLLFQEEGGKGTRLPSRLFFHPSCLL